MNTSFFLRIIFLIAALVVIGSFAVPKPEPIVLDISVSDITIEPVLITNDEQPTADEKGVAAQPKPKQASPPVILSDSEGSKSQIKDSSASPQNDFVTINPTQEPPKPVINLPSLTKQDLEEIMLAVVRVRCGGTFGSGAVIRINDKWYALTAAHVVIDRIAAKNYGCDIIFPRKDDLDVFKETYYRPGKILAPDRTKTQYENQAYDIAVLEVLPIGEDAQIFPDGRPFVGYPFCPMNTLQDDILLIGYPVNAGTKYTPGGIISTFPGVVAQYADIIGVEARPEAQFSSGFAYYPKLSNTKDASKYHPITVNATTNNFAGASGGLVFNVSKQCIVGINTATGVVNNIVYGISTNPAFPEIVNFLETAINPAPF